MMVDYIVDPSDSTKAIHAPSNRLAGSLYVAPIDTQHPVSVSDTEGWTHIGFVDPTDV